MVGRPAPPSPKPCSAEEGSLDSEGGRHIQTGTHKIEHVHMHEHKEVTEEVQRRQTASSVEIAARLLAVTVWCQFLFASRLAPPASRLPSHILTPHEAFIKGWE